MSQDFINASSSQAASTRAATIDDEDEAFSDNKAL